MPTPGPASTPDYCLRRWPIRLPLCIFAALWLLAAAPAPAQTTRPIETVAWTELHDTQRNRTLAITLCTPRDDQPHPVIIFSHGAYSSAKVYFPLADFWASHGYICILPNHADSGVFTTRDDSNDPWSGPQDYGAWGKPTTQGTWKPIWSERARDLVFLLRNFDLIEKAVPALRGRLDPKHIGIGGHSLGAFAAMLTCGTAVDIPGLGPNQSFADPQLHIAALLLISPQGRGQQGLRDGSWDKLSLPTMVVTGEYDTGVRDEPPTWREDPYLLSPPGGKYLLLFAGANHNSYFGQHVEQKDSNLPLQRKGEADQKLGDEIVHETQRLTEAFWDAYLKQEPAARQTLQNALQHPTPRWTIQSR